MGHVRVCVRAYVRVCHMIALKLLSWGWVNSARLSWNGYQTCLDYEGHVWTMDHIHRATLHYEHKFDL